MLFFKNLGNALTLKQSELECFNFSTMFLHSSKFCMFSFLSSKSKFQSSSGIFETFTGEDRIVCMDLILVMSYINSQEAELQSKLSSITFEQYILNPKLFSLGRFSLVSAMFVCLCLVQTVTSPKGLSGLNCPREVPKENFPGKPCELFRLLDENSDDYASQSYPRVNTEHVTVLPKISLTA